MNARKSRTLLPLASLLICIATTIVASAQSKSQIVVPKSTLRLNSGADHGAYTNVIMNVHPDSSAPGSNFETPASIACIYKVVPQIAGCPISGTTQTPTGSGGIIAIVDAYDYPTAAHDLSVFSSYFHLPAGYLQTIYASGSKPKQDPTGGWELEAALDIEWAHAMSPNATILLVEAASNSTSDLFHAVQVANSFISSNGGYVSMSWSGNESSDEKSSDRIFTTPNVVYLASTGDTAFEIQYPATSPNVIAVGGTSIQRNYSGDFTGEIAWETSVGGGGGGISAVEPIPPYQSNISSIVGGHRGVPDISAVADPNTGVAVYDTTPVNGAVPNWIQVGGTSVASPLMAGRLNTISQFSSTDSLLSTLYNLSASNSYLSFFRDITQGNSNCRSGWDICSGIGTLVGSKFPIISASQSLVDFGSFLNSSSRQVAKTVTFTNSSSFNINVSRAQIIGTGGQNDFFEITSDSCSYKTLSSSGSCSVTVVYDPANAGGSGVFQINDTLALESSALNSPINVAIEAKLNCPNGCSK